LFDIRFVDQFATDDGSSSRPTVQLKVQPNCRWLRNAIIMFGFRDVTTAHALDAVDRRRQSTAPPQAAVTLRFGHNSTLLRQLYEKPLLSFNFFYSGRRKQVELQSKCCRVRNASESKQNRIVLGVSE